MNRHRVVEAAAKLFLEKGYAYTSIDELVRVSKVSKSNVYYHFSNKEELLAGVIEYWINTYNDAIEKILVQDHLSVESRVMLFLTHLSQGIQEREFKGSCPFITLYIQSPEQAAQMKEKIAGFFFELQARIGLLLKQGIERGEFRNNIHIHEVSALFVTNLEGALFISEALKDASVVTNTAQQFFNLLR
ncbi:TetR/AcrR family transcriptional regulator [Aneurinibacillus uraniidurans]|uniref:TetR/AcrR family transcriptional regulator n=1 Tax=Aneurinibacillus uraniidurans TaxID=2966586 RepID=UPI00234BA40E|nr:TetR/AcrR family transcriptional regulator [Aneurinibacillus sp. B1]WCN38666.1 TetR/AcrR family transcriptional regulator [Aneurinibacillus sp. B1]